MAIQVYEATRNGEGVPLSVLSRQFISFSYGGKNIEDFNLLVVFANDRYEKNVYSSFNDTTTNQAELDGQLFWRSKYDALSVSFTLATDGMTEKELEDFKSWFIPGIERELILSEHHNRAVAARVASAPQMKMVPFEESAEVNIAGQFYSTSTTVYKGEILLEFVADNPYWYSISSFVSDLSQEELKIIYEDGLPHISMLKAPCFLANNLYYNGTSVVSNSGLVIDPEDQETDRYLYYCGTAKEKPIIEFKAKPRIDKEGKVFFNEDGFNFLKVGKSILTFTLPPVFSSYNKALDIINNFQGTSILDLRNEMRDELTEYYSRAWVIRTIDEARRNRTYISAEGEILEGFAAYFITEIKKFIPQDKAFLFTVNNKNGETFVKGEVGTYGEIEENCGNMIKSNYLTIEETTKPVNGKIDKGQMLQVISNFSLADFKIDYKYKYL